MSSRFFARGGSDSEDDDTEETDSENEETSDSGSSSDDSDSDSDSDSSSDDEDDEARGSRFLAGAGSDSDDDDDRRVVLSARDKRLHELSGVCEEIRNKIKINDWITCATLFDKMNKLWEKFQKMAALRGGRIKVPKIYLRTLVELEEGLSTVLGNKEMRKKMSTTNSKALNAMKQRLKKHNKDFESEMESFKVARPVVEGDEEEESEDDFEDDMMEEEEDAVEEAEKKEDIFTMDPKEVTAEMVDEKVKEIALTRGKKGTDRLEMVDQLSALVELAKSTEQKLQLLLLVVSSLFDLNPSLSSNMNNRTWQRTVVSLLDILDILQENPTLVFADDADCNPSVLHDTRIRTVPGNLMAFVERIDDELFKTFQVVDPHTHEYVVRLQDEIKFLLLARKATEYCIRFKFEPAIAKISLRSLEHLYYKHDKVYAAMRMGLASSKAAPRETEPAGADATDENGDAANESVPIFVFPDDFDLPEDMGEAMRNLCAWIYRFGDERTKARAMLCDIYHKAIHDDFYGARDLMLMSHLQDVIQNMDILTQILFNRAMAQLGLAAFRLGLIVEAHSCISELHMTGRIRELLAQGVQHSRFHEKTAEQEKLERRRQMPFHMHINLELLEAVHLTTAMLLEVPSMALHAHEPNRKVISRNFMRLLENYERLTFTGPPENVRDHVMAASKALMQGKWADSYEMIEKLQAWKLFVNSDSILAMIKRKIQEEALKAYLFTSAKCYASLSLSQLCSIFDMEAKHVQSIISKLIMAEDIQGSWDQTTGALLMHATEPTGLQSLSMKYADKLSLLLETNERALELRGGGRLSTKDFDDDGDRRDNNKRFDGNKRYDRDRDGNKRFNDRDKGSRDNRYNRDRYHGDRDGGRGDRGRFNRGGVLNNASGDRREPNLVNLGGRA